MLYWVGSMYQLAVERRFTGQLYRIEGDGSFEVVRRQVGIPNALTFDAERARMYFADSLHEMIWAYNYDLDSGIAGNETVFAEFSDLPGRPDGACVDSEAACGLPPCTAERSCGSPPTDAWTGPLTRRWQSPL